MAQEILKVPDVQGTIEHSDIAAIRIFPKPNHRELPSLVAVRFKKGGLAYYLSDDIGRAVSDVYLKSQYKETEFIFVRRCRRDKAICRGRCSGMRWHH